MSSLFSFGRRSPAGSRPLARAGRPAAYFHHQRRSSPDEYGYNVGCLDGVNPFDIGEVPVNDGVNHPADAKRA